MASSIWVANFSSNTVSILLNNTPPTITPDPVTLNAGNPSANSQIALVDDAQDGPNTLRVTVNGGTSATVNGVTVTLNPTAPNASGQVFADVIAACGATTADFKLRVNDGCLFSPEATLTVTVNPDNQPPTITCPGNVAKSNDPSQCCAVATFSPTVNDNCPGATSTCSPPSGTCFPVGMTTVTCTAKDAANNMSSCNFTVTVTDTTPPVITCPVNQTLSANANCQAAATYTATATDNCTASPAVMCTPPSGSTFTKGVTTVNCTATDGGGNTAMCSFSVTVNDTQAPSITCPGNITTTAASCPPSSSRTVNFTVTASDNCPGVTTVCKNQNNQVVISGSSFPVGTTMVTCTATDASNNTASCSFTVTVFSGCLQDDSDPSRVVLFNSQTGEYRFCCGGITFTGMGTVTIKGCVVTIQHDTADRRVQISLDGAVGRGSASLQSPPGTTSCTIIDRNTANNSCVCQ